MGEKAFLLCVILFAYGVAVSQVKVRTLLTENLSNPICLDMPQPRFSWQLVSFKRNVFQTAYEVIVTSGKSFLWKSGKVKTDQSLYVTYKGDPLKSGKKYDWSVRVWDNNDKPSTWSEKATFQMALLNKTDWKAKWIGYDGVFSPAEKPDDRFTRVVARYLRKDFSIKKNIKKATVYISGVGLYELYLNGNKVGNDVLAPGPTDYAKRVFYNTFDITSQLKKGGNAVGVILGNGRFVAIRQHLEDTTNNCVNYGFPKLLMQMEVTFNDNATQTIISDESWMISGDGPVIANNEFDGEEYDATKEFKNWTKAGFIVDSRWRKTELVAPAAPIVQSQLNPPIREMETLNPVAITNPKPGMYVFKLAQNMVGWARLKVNGSKGTQVKLRFAERLKDDGTIYTENLGDARVTDIYTIKGEGTEIWEPRFTYHGFQYIEITGFPGTPSLESIECKVVHDNMDVIGKIATSNDVLNKIYHNMYWGIRSNYRGIPTDCPQRDERMGWLGDRAAVGTGESFMFNTHLFYAKWMQDIEDAQNEAGSIPDVAPAYWRMYTDNTTWPSAYVYNIDMLYKQFGDDAPVKKFYASIKKWLAYLEDRYMKDFIITENTYGDWCVPPETLTMIFSEDPARKTPGDYLSTAFYYDMLRIMIRFAAISNNKKDVEYFTTLAKNVKEGFNRKFFNAEKKCYANNTTTANVLALA
ncbi:MAG: family 78 glycoside hydrolase catalytic domain, partial [Bacteroidota bacterium]